MPVPVMPPARPAAPPHGEVEGTLLMQSPSLAAMASAPPVVAAKPAPAAEKAPAKKGLPILPIAAAGGVALLVVIGILGARYMKRGEAVSPTPAPPTPTAVASVAPTPTPPPAVPVTGSLRVESQPPGATVTLNGVAKGTTPVALADLPMGEHELKLELKGYAPTVEKVVLAAEAPSAELKLTLSKTAPPVGSAAIRSVPPGALVRVDGIAVGLTPIKDHKMKVGSHTVDVSAEGFESWSGTVTIKEGKRASVDTQLKAIPKATPTPEVKADVVDPNKVYASNEVDAQPKKLSGASAAYPKNAPGLKSGEAVSVAVEYVVNQNGEVADIKVAQSGGQAVDEAVAAAVSKWKYTPGVKKGIKVKVRVTFRQTFKAG
jgi:TonB family protein